ncbi:DUF5813 family protein [Haloarcula pellucida]|uniref:Uncharacterized protein n=1 Tax=Haloarcula pellucida TaxID=1427151 RepID=A0A830GJ81_9EURY|nr:DUF5813 family protein [Halomicroarcula pellucida]MBX0348593.1 hypothetical protein [Halomicroarcula pellucida]GGN92687.1 hypothetical protein GCM10009030_17170 [Halomicroarcula pellucida]
MTDVPADVERVFDDRDGFVAGGDGYALETTRFDGRVTASEGEAWKTDYEVTVRAPSLQAATADEVGPAVADGWFETFERRLEDAPKSTRVAVELDEYTVERDGEDVVVTYRFSLGGEREAADAAKAFVEYVEGTYVEGIVPGYDYVGTVADLLDSASTGGSEGTRGGTPL